MSPSILDTHLVPEGPYAMRPICKVQFVQGSGMGSEVRASLWLELASRCLKVNGGGETLYVLWMGGWEMPGTWLCGWLAWSGCCAPAGGVSQAPTPGRPLDEGAEGYTAPCPGICPLPRCGDRSPAVLILRAWKCNGRSSKEPIRIFLKNILFLVYFYYGELKHTQEQRDQLLGTSPQLQQLSAFCSFYKRC